MIILPMAGLSRRFFDAGYKVPKYRLEVGGSTVLETVLLGLLPLCQHQEVLFVARDFDLDVEKFIFACCKNLSVPAPRVVILSKPTLGQADTVYQALQVHCPEGNEGITIFNIDTFRKNFSRPSMADLSRADGYLEVFRGEGANWSYAKPSDRESGVVLEAREKKPISDLCCTGLYYFKSSTDFVRAFENPEPAKTEAEAKERYVAPLFNSLIAEGKRILYHEIDQNDVVFCGTPQEYERLAKQT